MFQLLIKSDIIYTGVKYAIIMPISKEDKMGGPYNIPRDYKGESKILFIFSRKAFMYTAGGGFIGILIFYLMKLINVKYVGAICIVLFAFIGFALGTFKIPDIKTFKITQKTGGEYIDQVLLRWFKFKRSKNKIYVYKKEENKNVK